MAHKYERLKKIDDPRSTEELVSLLLMTKDELAQWDIIFALQRRGDAGVFSAACALCERADPEQRILGILILTQDGVKAQTLRRQSIPFLLQLIKQETQSEVLAALGSAFRDLKDSATVRPLRSLRHHPNADVRQSVVQGLCSQTNALAIETLIELTEDEEDKVRQWATFGLGNQMAADTPEIREALVKRLNDSDYDTHCYALASLVRRKDERAIEPLISELTEDYFDRMHVMGAQKLGDPRLLPALIQLQARWGADDPELQAAIKSCSSEPS